jgi:hypothetical protein
VVKDESLVAEERNMMVRETERGKERGRKRGRGRGRK